MKYKRELNSINKYYILVTFGMKYRREINSINKYYILITLGLHIPSSLLDSSDYSHSTLRAQGKNRIRILQDHIWDVSPHSSMRSIKIHPSKQTFEVISLFQHIPIIFPRSINRERCRWWLGTSFIGWAQSNACEFWGFREDIPPSKLKKRDLPSLVESRTFQHIFVLCLNTSNEFLSEGQRERGGHQRAIDRSRANL